MASQQGPLAEGIDAQTATRVRRRELGAFLRQRRERLSPRDLGLASSGQRRTPGLRREEVARLAGVGASWYTWLEQGRSINVSSQVLTAIARTLQLDADERAYLFTLAELPDLAVWTDRHDVPAPVLQVLDHMSPYPAFIQTTRYDILAYNRPYGRLFPELDGVPPDERNFMWLTFTHPAWRRAFPDWEGVTSRMVARYRVRMAEHLSEPGWSELLTRLRAAAPEFGTLWASGEVRIRQAKHRKLHHDEVGPVEFSVVSTWLQPRIGPRMLTYVPVDAVSAHRFDILAGDGG
jgi:transcriptional regulator with XRE-family HTH domain